MNDRPLISIEGLAKRFAADGAVTTVFEDIWFGVEKSEFVCLIGHSGCGKTTILNVLAGLDAPSDGVVIVDNREISGPGCRVKSGRPRGLAACTSAARMTCERRVAFSLPASQSLITPSFIIGL